MDAITHHYYAHGKSDLEEEGFACLLLFQAIAKYPLEKGESFSTNNVKNSLSPLVIIIYYFLFLFRCL